MDITEVRIKLMSDPQDRLQAFCSITIDGCFVVRDLKIIQGHKGSFVAMPSRKLTDRCPKCHAKNHLRSNYCSQCGARLPAESNNGHVNGRTKLYADIAHPINSECRESIQEKVIEAFEQELIESKKPGYICRYDDYGEEDYGDWSDHSHAASQPPAAQSPSVAEKIELTNGQSLRFDPPEDATPAPPSAPIEKRESQPAAAHQPSDADAEKPSSEDFGQGIV